MENTRYGWGGLLPAVHTHTNQDTHGILIWELFPLVCVFFRKSRLHCSLLSLMRWDMPKQQGRQGAAGQGRGLAHEGTSSPRHKDSQLQGSRHAANGRQRAVWKAAKVRGPLNSHRAGQGSLPTSVQRARWAGAEQHSQKGLHVVCVCVCTQRKCVWRENKCF